MPFTVETKTEMFIRCGRLCCLCLKQCGTNIEAAHIIDEAAGGSNDADNGIPVCFDCHQEMGAYSDKHPRGNKIRPEELRARRDRVYHLVETGIIYAQIIAERARSAAAAKELPKLAKSPEPPKPSAEATRFLKSLLAPAGPPDAAGRKLALLNATSRAYVLDELQRFAPEDSRAITALARILRASAFPREEAILLVEQVMRGVTLFGKVDQKVTFLREFPDDELLREVYEGLRLAFFDDLIQIVFRDQFGEVNELVPVLVTRVGALPEGLYSEYVRALLDQARSSSFRGAPAARGALTHLPEPVVKAGLDNLTVDQLSSHLSRDEVKAFIAKYRNLANAGQREILDDFVTLSPSAFFRKHCLDE